MDINSKSVDRLKVEEGKMAINSDLHPLIVDLAEGDKNSKLILDVWGHVILACSSSPTHAHSVVYITC